MKKINIILSAFLSVYLYGGEVNYLDKMKDFDLNEIEIEKSLEKIQDFKIGDIQNGEYLEKLKNIDLNNVNLEQLELSGIDIDSFVKKELGVFDSIDLNDFSFENLSPEMLNKISQIPNLEGLENLEYLDKIKDIDFGNLDMGNLPDNIGDFNFDMTAFDSLTDIKSLTSTLGFSGSSIEKVQELILLNGQLNLQLSGQNIKSTQLIMLYNQILLEWEKSLHNAEIIKNMEIVEK